jgi:hypothetical protein
MDALKMSAVGRPSGLRTAEVSSEPAGDERLLAPRIGAALDALLDAAEYAHDLGTGAWDFALEIASLRRMKLSNSDLRWLVVRGLVEHALEIAPGENMQRSFRPAKRLVFGKKSCFVLAPAGLRLAHALRGSDGSMEHAEAISTLSQAARESIAAPSQSPKWDRDRHELRIGPVLIKRFTIPSAGQEAILAAFEENGWPARIDDPLPSRDEPSRKARLQETVGALNRTLRRPFIEFSSDASGRGVLWEFRGESPASGGG